jgi:hypothetical protein
MIKVHYQQGGGPFDDDPVKNKTFKTDDPAARVFFNDTWVEVRDGQGLSGRLLFAVQGFKITSIEGKHTNASEG